MAAGELHGAAILLLACCCYSAVLASLVKNSYRNCSCCPGLSCQSPLSVTDASAQQQVPQQAMQPQQLYGPQLRPCGEVSRHRHLAAEHRHLLISLDQSRQHQRSGRSGSGSRCHPDRVAEPGATHRGCRANAAAVASILTCSKLEAGHTLAECALAEQAMQPVHDFGCHDFTVVRHAPGLCSRSLPRTTEAALLFKSASHSCSPCCY